MDWTDDKVAILTKMWGDGFSARQIASELKEGVTRCAVIGKATRLGISKRQIKTKGIVGELSPTKIKTCEFPVDNPMGGRFNFCGLPVTEPYVDAFGNIKSYPYCDEHCLVAYRTGVKSKEGQDGLEKQTI